MIDHKHDLPITSSLARQDAPLIDAENLFRQAGPPLTDRCNRPAMLRVRLLMRSFRDRRVKRKRHLIGRRFIEQ
jgi:hypothetical protein